ncbi:MAG TPA: AAA family ATPase [Longimicrobium sp.]
MIANREKLAEAIEICRAIWADLPSFDQEERDYKLKISERIRAAINAAASGGDFLPLLKKAFSKPNNLTDFRAHGRFIEWATANPQLAREALLALVAVDLNAAARVDRFLSLVPTSIVAGIGGWLSIASFFLFGSDPATFPIYRSTPLQTAERVLGYPESPPARSSAGGTYAHHATFVREFGQEVRSAGVPLRDMLDAQSLIFTLAKKSGGEFATWRDESPTITTGKDERVARDAATVSPTADLAARIERFHKEYGYPTREDMTDLRAREDFESYLNDVLDSDEPRWRMLQTIVSSHVYGSPGPQSGLNRYINNADEAESKRLQETLRYLLRGTAPLAARLDRVLDGDLKIPGLGESGAMKLLAIMRPTDVVPVFPFRGPKGKAALMAGLELQPPAAGTRGELAARANEMIVERLSPYFGDDAHGMKRFLYWLADPRRGGGGTEPPRPETEALDRLADDLLVEPGFMADMVEMLRERKQVILYGPPGTGKTYLARALMEHLAPSPTRYTVVQFHPSYSYEDFVQGYRPEAGENGQLGYRLKAGPLMRLAEAAAADPSREYVLLIDEINRGNLPKIFGELLYLLEYRDQAVTPMYGEEGEEFSLPSNLLVIGTMNTADRSIALVDAALRRRFHFVALFPDEGPLAGFLARWLERNRPEMAHVAPLVTALNRELKERLGVNAQVGHSYFTRGDLSERTLARVWAHDIMPFLEDQLFGQEAELTRFTLDALRGAADANDHTAGTPDDDA